jgi:hypothetical protein
MSDSANQRSAELAPLQDDGSGMRRSPALVRVPSFKITLMTTTFSAVGVATPAGWYDTDSTRLSRRRSQLEPRESKERMLRLNEDGEVDFRGSWRDTWHQRGLLVLNFAFLILGFALLFVGIYAIRTNPVGMLETLTSMQYS